MRVVAQLLSPLSSACQVRCPLSPSLPARWHVLPCMSELLLPTPPPSAVPSPVWGGLARAVTLPPCRSCVFPPRVTPLGLCCPLSSPRGSAAPSLWRGAVVRGCPSAWTSLRGGVSLPALAPSLNVLALPFRPLPDCVGEHRASMCRGGRGGELCVPSRGLSRRAVPPGSGSGARCPRVPRTRLRGVSCDVVRPSPRAPSLCTCAGGLGRGEGAKRGDPDRKCLPFSSPRARPSPVSRQGGPRAPLPAPSPRPGPLPRPAQDAKGLSLAPAARLRSCPRC